MIMNNMAINFSIKNQLKPWLVCFAASLFFFYEFIQMNMFNAISQDLMKEFGLSGESLGYLSSTYLFADVVCLFPAGMLLDRFSVKKIIVTAMLICISATVIFGLTHHFSIAAAAHFAAGIGNAFCFLSCMTLASRWFEPRQMALVTGLIVTFAMLGGIFAQAPMAFLAQNFGWRNAVLINAGLGVIILFIILLNVQDYPIESETMLQANLKKLNQLGLWHSIKKVFQNSQNWLAGLYTSLLNLPIMLLGALYGNLNLIEIHHLSSVEASYVTSMIFLGTTIGSPILGYYSDKIALRKKPMLIFALLSLINICIIIFIPGLSYAALLQLYFLLGFLTSAQVLSYPLITESNSRMITGTAMGLASVLIMGGGAVAQPLFGWLLDLDWNHTLINNTPWFSQTDFKHAFIMIPFAFSVSILCSLFLKETYCKNISE